MPEIIPSPPTPKRRPTHPEWAVQRGVRRFVRRAVVPPFEFVSYDRGKKVSPLQHILDAQRGLRRDWPDTMLLVRGRVFLCELKAPGVILKREDEQYKMIERLASLDHHAAWANSVMMYAEAALAAGILLTANWRTVAAHEDELVAGDIRGQKVQRKKAARKVAPRFTMKRAAYGRAGKAGILL